MSKLNCKELIGDVFIPLKRNYYLGRLAHGTPYFYPINFNSSILSFRKLILTPQEELDKYENPWIKESKRFKNLPIVRRAKDKIFKIFNQYYWVEIGWPIMISKTELGYKDKFNSPRFEWNPSFQIYFFKWQFSIFWKPPVKNEDLFWEMVLWYNYYSDKDINKAKETWGWIDYNTKQSTWNDNYLK